MSAPEHPSGDEPVESGALEPDEQDGPRRAPRQPDQAEGEREDAEEGSAQEEPRSRWVLEVRHAPGAGAAVLEQEDGRLRVDWRPVGTSEHSLFDVDSRDPWPDFERQAGLEGADWHTGADHGDELGRARVARHRTSPDLIPSQTEPLRPRPRGDRTD